jgi:hypothetical protein
MKKVLWLIVCLMTMVLSVNAQSNETQETYCMIVGTQKFMSSKCTFTIDYGQATRFMDGDRKMKMVDENGETIKFNSLMDACNYLASLDWVLVNAYAMGDSKQGSCYHYVFKKIINKGEEVKFNTKGNTAKAERKKKKENDDLYN